MLTLTKEDFAALGRELVDQSIAAFQQALTDHATTVDVPAPTAHPLIEKIVRENDGQYTVADLPVEPPRDLAAELDALKQALITNAVITEAEVTAIEAKPLALG